jgi:hypothetical protein
MINAFRLNTGEYVICDICEDSADTIMCKDALLFEQGMSRNAKGEAVAQIGFRSLVPFGKPGTKISLRKSDIMFFLNDIDQQIIDQYNSIISPVTPVRTISDEPFIKHIK